MIVDTKTSKRILDLADDAAGGIHLLIDLPIDAKKIGEMRKAAQDLLVEINKLKA